MKRAPLPIATGVCLAMAVACDHRTAPSGPTTTPAATTFSQPVLADGELFTRVDSKSVPTTLDVTTLRSRLVRIDIRRLAAARDAARGSGTLVRLRLNLFDDAVFGSVVTESAPTSSGGYSLSGRLDGADLGTMVMVVNGTLVAGTVQSPPETYTIRPASGGGIHIIRQVDGSTLPPEANPPGAATSLTGYASSRTTVSSRSLK